MNEFELLVRFTAFNFAILGLAFVFSRNSSSRKVAYITVFTSGGMLGIFQGGWAKPLMMEQFVLFINFVVVAYHLMFKHPSEKSSKNQISE